ncbi:spore germination protein KA [Paenibacillus cellulosilyticus]|uniref:Spore germination protein KA n=1 Tax=Paenibacillus cellulosilyticus TaxID=375489 RepID=A0A2V2YV89_9BACL|nr:spore germination protein [Paenibacillus cellulosilyticus]PWW04769.1 spore germination protein KA [Paenibacillus cellulosilyticus]QKS45892.1 spore germination protein [Paenibacillus cellulosilyticus]
MLQTEKVPYKEEFTSRLDDNHAVLQEVLGDNADIIFHFFQTGNHISALCVYCSSLCDSERLERQLLSPIVEDNTSSMSGISVPMSSVQNVHTIDQAILAILNGQALLLLEDQSIGRAYSVPKTASRAVEEPTAESTVRGPREGFTEDISTNLSLLRKRMRTPALKLIATSKGQYTNTDIVLAYVDGLLDPALLEEVGARLRKLHLKGVLESQYIEKGLADEQYSPFPQMIATERPDVVAANLLEGRFALLIDGTPFSLIAPVSIFSLLQSPEDYYENKYMSISIRWLRYFFAVISVMLPSAYVAITTFHQEMIPTVLLLSIARAREEIPFPALVEAMIMEISFEALREAGVRLPKQVGAAVSIVGALIIGQAATSAGIVSAPMVIIVALTGIASFMIPRYAAGIVSRLLRFPIMLLAGTLGLVGMMLGVLVIVIHLSSLRSFGMPYLSLSPPASAKGRKDVWWCHDAEEQANRPMIES